MHIHGYCPKRTTVAARALAEAAAELLCCRERAEAEAAEAHAAVEALLGAQKDIELADQAGVEAPKARSGLAAEDSARSSSAEP